MKIYQKYSSILISLFIFSIVLLGFFLRAQETISGNFLFLLDSGRDMMDVKKIVFDHKLTLIGPYTSLGGVFQGPLYYYLLAIPTAIFSGDPRGNILLMLLLSMTVLGVVFYYMNKYFGLIPAIITLVLFAFSPEAIAAATYFWNPHPMWLIITMYIFALYGAITKDKWSQIALWPLAALSFHFQMAFGVFLSIATLVYALLFARGIFRNKNIWLGLSLGAILFLPQILFEFRHNFLMTRSVIDVIGGSTRGLITSGEHADTFSVFMRNFHTWKQNFISSFIHENQFRFLPGLLSLLSIAACTYSVFTNVFSKHEKRFLYMIISVIIIITLLCLVYPFPLRYWFLTGFQSFYLILAGIMLSKLYPLPVGKAALFCIMAILLLYSTNKLYMLYVAPPNDGGSAKITGKINAIDYIYQDAKGKKFGVMVFTPPVLTDAYDYLFWWYGNRTYGFVPTSIKSGTVYLLMEPDPEKPWSYKGWLETVIKTGTIESTFTLPSGIIIQKRLM